MGEAEEQQGEETDGRPVDCTNDVGLPYDAVPTYNGLAIKHFGAPFGQLARKHQTMIRAVVDGNRRELDETVKSLKRNNLLSAEQKKARMYDAADRADTLHDHVLNDVEDLINNGDDMDVSLHDVNVKNKSGSVRAKLRTLTALERLNTLRLRNQQMIIEMEKQDTGPKVVVNNDNRQVAVSPAEVSARLGKFGGVGGQIVDESG